MLLEKGTIRKRMSEQKKNVDLTSLDLSQKHFLKISKMIYQMCGISLREGKEALVRFRLLNSSRETRDITREDACATHPRKLR